MVHARKGRVQALLEALMTHLETKGSKSVSTIRSHLKPVQESFGHLRALSVTSSQLEEYVRQRQEVGKANATINRGLQSLRAAFHLARKQGRLSRLPHFPILKEDNVRRGFFEAEEFERVVEHLPAAIADAARFAYRTGWRKSEVVGLRWEHVDRIAGEVRLYTSKNGEGRSLPLVGLLWDLIEKRWQAREFRLCNSTIGLADFVFHCDGKPLGDFRKAWASACRAAGVPGKLFHDLRRTAARDMIRSGVPETVARTITGHKTRSMFDRYNITSEADKRAALERVDAKVYFWKEGGETRSR